MKYSGRIIKGVSGYYYVKCDDTLIECRARGLFRKQNIKPLVGDMAEVESEDGKTGTVINIQSRRNELIRPKVSNIDCLLIILSANHPRPDLLLCDKLLISSLMNNIEPVICVNKIDEPDEEVFEDIRNSYKTFNTFFISAKEGLGINEIKDFIKGRTVALAGQSAVGKSSLINSIESEFDLETGGLSVKSMRGRHTTRMSELMYLKSCDALIIDTPGFSSFDFKGLEPEDLRLYYPDFMLYNHRCGYTSCVHMNEPECGVKDAVDSGLIPKSRYERYLKLLSMLYETKERKA